MERLIREFPKNINVRSEEFNTDILSLLLSSQFKKEVETVLDAGANPNIPDSTGSTPIFYAAGSFDENLIKKFLKAKADPNVLNKQGDTPLTWMLNLNGHFNKLHLSAMKVLIEEGKVDVNQMRPDTPNFVGYQSALTKACSLQNKEGVQYLLEKGADPNIGYHIDYDAKKNLPYKYTPLFIAAKTNNLPILKMLVDHGGKINELGIKVGKYPKSLHSLLHITTSVEVMKYLIEEKNMNVNMLNAYKRTPLQYHTKFSSNTEITDYLRSKGGN